MDRCPQHLVAHPALPLRTETSPHRARAAFWIPVAPQEGSADVRRDMAGEGVMGAPALAWPGPSRGSRLPWLSGAFPARHGDPLLRGLAGLSEPVCAVLGHRRAALHCLPVVPSRQVAASSSAAQTAAFPGRLHHSAVARTSTWTVAGLQAPCPQRLHTSPGGSAELSQGPSPLAPPATALPPPGPQTTDHCHAGPSVGTREAPSPPGASPSVCQALARART